MIGTAAALLGSAAISTGGSILGGLFGKSAAQKAAEQQAAYAKAAGEKVEGAVRDANPQIGESAHNAGDMVLRAANGVTDTAGRSKADLDLQTSNANALLNPYVTTGQTATTELNKGLVEGGTFNKTPTIEDITIDPAFNFRLKQAQEAIERSAAARGGASSGEALKDLTNFSQGLASTEYGNAFQRYRQITQDRFGNLTSAAESGRAAATKSGDNLTSGARTGGDWLNDAAKTNVQANEFAGSLGFDAATKMADNTIGGARSAAEYLTQQGNAKAAGIVGGANATSGAISGVTGGLTNALLLGALLKNPAASAPKPETKIYQ